jgi:hypothetical protein
MISKLRGRILYLLKNVMFLLPKGARSTVFYNASLMICASFVNPLGTANHCARHAQQGITSRALGAVLA